VRLHLVDGTFELFRAHYSKRPGHLDPGGRDLKATVGLAESLLALLRDPGEAVTHAAIAFDNPIRSFRNELLAGYKSDEGVPAELRAQFDDAEEAARALGLVVWSMDRFEADDALATAAARFRGEVDEVRILTPDKDLGQCLVDGRVVLVDRIRGRVIDEAALRARRGFGPASVPDFLALTGDDADGIPGLPGFGERTASALLGAFPRLEAIPRDPRAWPDGLRGADRLAATLAARWGEALLYRRLATLATDVPLRESLEDLRWAGVPRGRLEGFCERTGARRVLEAARAGPTRWAAGAGHASLGLRTP
jgi:5'-3' exonuclease